jgi:hypothetical protein
LRIASLTRSSRRRVGVVEREKKKIASSRNIKRNINRQSVEVGFRRNLNEFICMNHDRAALRSHIKILIFFYSR